MRWSEKSSSRFNFNVMTRKVDVENRPSLRNDYRIADDLPKQVLTLLSYNWFLNHFAGMYLDGGNKFHRRVCYSPQIFKIEQKQFGPETMPCDRDYQPFLCPKERTTFRKKLFSVLDELETLKLDSISYSNKQVPIYLHLLINVVQIPWFTSFKAGNIVQAFILGPNGFCGQRMGPGAEIKLYQVNPPTNTIMDSGESSSVNQAEKCGLVAIEDCDSEVENSTLDSVLSLDEGRWLHAAEESGLPPKNELENNDIQWGNIRQPMPPPVLAQVHPELLPICPSRSSKISEDGLSSSISYQDHIPVKMMEGFLRLAQENTAKNLETCGILAGSLRNRVFRITTLIIPKQESTSDSCQTLNEEEIFEVQDTRSLFSLGWIHTHPTQTCFMSSVDLHTHYSYQVMLPEAIAIVMAPTDTSSPHGIFHLCDPAGVAVIRNCQQRGFHPHQGPQDGSPIYEHCSHVYMNAKLMFDVVDLR
ncbi:UNVERIFIED_CONTAM: AMSH-like ubiquitin thioesterase 3 [Sesamum latifolium]|uniref:AMSH-like ubiquitin thioesterase 3 n=1 Tax=Sesamum latifolium TaxID=2727402 RepID=A0AAW2VX93_9LAMI